MFRIYLSSRFVVHPVRSVVRLSRLEPCACVCASPYQLVHTSALGVLEALQGAAPAEIYGILVPNDREISLAELLVVGPTIDSQTREIARDRYVHFIQRRKRIKLPRIYFYFHHMRYIKYVSFTFMNLMTNIIFLTEILFFFSKNLVVMSAHSSYSVFFILKSMRLNR